MHTPSKSYVSLLDVAAFWLQQGVRNFDFFLNKVKNGTIHVILTSMHLKYLKPIFHCNANYLGLALGNAPNASILHWGYQHVGILEPTQTLKFALPPTPNPNASQWNIGVVGTQRKHFRVGHVHFMFFV